MERSPVLEGSLVLGRYRIVKPLARGGMGMVYLGRVEGAAGFAKPVVIKRILSEEDGENTGHSSFIREARILSELQHPGIVGVLDFGLEKDTYLMVLEYVHGYHVGHWLRYVRQVRGELEWEFSVYILLRVLEALQYAHRHVGADGQVREVIHRDISPGNILIDFGGRVRLVDFGIARAKGFTAEFKTEDGVVKGKLPYIAPEVYRSQEPGASADVYAAGVVLYQLLTGNNPFSDRDMSKIVRRVLEDMPAPLTSLRSDIPASMDDVVARAIAKSPAERFASARDFSVALASLLNRPEAEIAEHFRAAVTEDFAGTLPELLRVESLSSRDAAWRASATNPAKEPSLLRSSIPPAPPGDNTVVVPVQDPGSRTGGAPPGERSMSKRLIAVSLAFAATLGALAVLLLARGGAEKREPRYLLVERPGKQSLEAEARPAQPDPALSASGTEGAEEALEQPTSEAALVASAAEAGSRPASPAARKETTSGAQALTAAFAKRQGAVQSCFSTHASSLEGAPQLTIRFQVAPSGEVSSATLSPAAVAGTNLGRCLLEVARGTRFPPQEQAVTFSIPITARVIPGK